MLAAGGQRGAASEQALDALCRAYWYPIYAYVRRKGHEADEAQDLTQEFFAQIIAKDRLRLADREKGRFRTFLLAMLDYFLAREWKRAHRQKRGGGVQFISLDQQTPEERYRLEPVDGETPEKHFRREWALTILRQTMSALERECAAVGKAALFGEVKNLISGERGDGVYSGISARLGMAEGAVRVAVHRLRGRYGELLRAEIAQTVESPDEVEGELRELLLALSK